MNNDSKFSQDSLKDNLVTLTFFLLARNILILSYYVRGTILETIFGITPSRKYLLIVQSVCDLTYKYFANSLFFTAIHS